MAEYQLPNILHPKIVSIDVRMATPEDQHLEAYDNTKLTAINTCPTWGVLRYQMHRTYSAHGRAMALEAGGAMHEVFAALRLWQLKYHTLKGNPLADAFFDFHGRRLFNTKDNPERFEQMISMIDGDQDERTNKFNFCLSALFSCGFYDDPSDRRRTLSNLEEAAVYYIERYDLDRMPIWVRDLDDPTSDVGIEIGFDCVITFNFIDDTSVSYRFTGKLDGIHLRDDSLCVGENKTASRLDDAWRMSFEMASQVTGYCIAAFAFTTQPVEQAVVYGTQIPLPKNLDLGGNEHNFYSRESYHFERWFLWFLHTVTIAETYKDNPFDAPKYTHSCNRYFRPCSFIPFCASSDEDQREAVNEMVIDEWSPLHEMENKAGD